MAYVEEWPPARFDAELRARERVLVLYDASWCAAARPLRARFEAAEPDAVVPLARADLARDDARWDAYGIRVAPTLVYYEHGEELERLEGVMGRGLAQADLDEMLELVASIQPEPVLPKRMHGPRRS